MRLYRNLLFILLAIFLVSVILVCLVEPTSVMSRIATGLITGSFVGAINTFVNYVHLRVSFFDSLSRKLFDVSLYLMRDYSEAKIRNEYLETISKTDIISDYTNYSSELEKDIERFERQYRNVDELCNIYAYAPLFPWEKQVKSAIGKLEEALTQLTLLPGLFQGSQCFHLMSFDDSEIQPTLINELFDSLIKSNKNLANMMKQCLERLGLVCKILSLSSTSMLSPDAIRRFKSIDDIICQPMLKDDPLSSYLNQDQEASS